MNMEVQGVNEARSIEPFRQRHIQAIREAGKADRRALTDAIQEFVEYVDGNGEGASKPELAYSNMTRTIYAPFGLNVKARDAKELALQARNTFDETELSYLQVAERTAAEIIWAGMTRKDTRHAIKTAVRDSVHRLAGMLREIRKIREAA